MLPIWRICVRCSLHLAFSFFFHLFGATFIPFLCFDC
uniref:Uncharacterized protein n=1 Tax=Rhizophora mucronata TaxID=61149 RepID=A0A2P2III4_RHIMU